MNETTVFEIKINPSGSSVIFNKYGDVIVDKTNFSYCYSSIPSYFIGGGIKINKASFESDCGVALHQDNDNLAFRCNYIKNNCKYVITTEISDTTLKVEYLIKYFITL